MVLALIAVPFVIMRAAMMELDCFVARRKDLDRAARGEYSSIRGGRRNEDEVDALLVSTFTFQS